MRLVQTQAKPVKKEQIEDIHIPDLWQVAMNQEEEFDRDKILEVWHLCHSLKKHIETYC